MSQRPLRQFMGYHPVAGVWNLPRVRARVVRPGAPPWLVRINSAGVRDDREFMPEAPVGRERVVVLGDSFTFGYGVDVAHRFSSRLEALRPNLECVNVGVCSTGVDQQTLLHEVIALPWDTGTLLWTPYLNNISRCALRAHPFETETGAIALRAKPYFTLERGALVRHHSPVPDARTEVMPSADAPRTRNLEGQRPSAVGRVARALLLNRQYKFQAARWLPLDAYPELRSDDQPLWQLAAALFASVQARRHGRPAVIAPLPSWSVVMAPGRAGYRDRFGGWAAKAGWHFVDVLPAFARLSTQDRIRCFLSATDTHYSPFGHSVVAEALAHAWPTTAGGAA